MIKRFSYSLKIVASLIFTAVLIVSGPTAAALNQSDLNSIYNDTVWYGPGINSCTGGAVAPGNGTPTGASFPNLNPQDMASAINSWVAKENSSSTLNNLGSTIVAGAKNSNVSPFLIVAIAAEETSLGDPDSYNVKHANNPFSRKATPEQPNYPGAGDNAGTLWYKWSSVKASVDYTAPENQNAVGGGDIATYIRNVYSSQLDAGDLLALFEKYAPVGDNNDPAAYASKVTGWINDMVALTEGGPATPEAPASIDGCSGTGISAGSIVQTAMGLAWPSGNHPSDPTSAYKAALAQYNSSTGDPTDCGGFVATVMHASGADASYVGVYVPSQYDYINKNSSRYQVIKGVKDTFDLQVGDILIYINPSNPGDSHTFIYVGKQPGFGGDGAGASLGGHVPQAVSASGSFAYNGRAASGNYMAIRLVQ